MAKYVVRYGSMRTLGVLSTRGQDRFDRGEAVIARTNRGLEIGEVLCEATEQVVGQMNEPPYGQILRKMTTDDEIELNHLRTQETSEFEACQRHVEELSLEMELVDIEHIFGGERVVVYYLAEQRVDFRELVKRLAAEFQTRIEMRQIGVRDEAKLLADYGDCGKPVCCNTHLTQMPPVSMKMAKLQKATLDPTKISGRCGRLKCCLRYEYDTYEHLLKQLPKVGVEVITELGRAKILAHEILAQQLLVQTEDNRRVLIHAADVLSVIGKRTSSSATNPDSAKSSGPPAKSDRHEPRETGRKRGRKEEQDRLAPAQDASEAAEQVGRDKKPGGDPPKHQADSPTQAGKRPKSDRSGSERRRPTTKTRDRNKSGRSPAADEPDASPPSDAQSDLPENEAPQADNPTTAPEEPQADEQARKPKASAGSEQTNAGTSADPSPTQGDSDGSQAGRSSAGRRRRGPRRGRRSRGKENGDSGPAST